MRLFTNSSNVNSLKVQVAAELAGNNLQVVGVAPNDARVGLRNILPVLEVQGSRFFLPAPAAIFILQEAGLLSDKEVSSCSGLIEWESGTLYPTCLSFLQAAAINKNPDTSLKSSLSSALTFLAESCVKGYIKGDKLGILDILVWCDLYPLATDKIFRKEVEKFPAVISWFDKLQALESFKKPSEKFGRGLDGCKGSVSSLVGFTRQAVKVPTPEQDSESKPKENPVSEEELKTAKAAWTHSAREARVGPGAGPVLPQEGKRNILITAALPYVNNVPHLGNIVGCVLSADIYARFTRLRGYNVLFVCGTDEYGTSTETKAVEEGLTPRQICDKYNVLHSEIYEWFSISFDKFGRTTTERQTEIAQQIFWDLHKAGKTSEASVDQLHCEPCDRFLADRFVEGECPLCGFADARGDQCDACGKLINAVELKSPRCKLCSKGPKIRTSNHLFLDLPQLEEELGVWLDKSSEKWSNNARVIAKSWLKGGLQPRCITRDLKWGTPVPLQGYENKVFYVWFDAPIGYISITADYTSDWKLWWKNPENVEYWQFMAKDNVPFHSVVFPSTLLGTGQKWTLVNRLMSTEYLNYEDAKFSKSRGVGVFGNDAKETGIPADVWRFYLMYTRPENQDSTFKWEDLMLKNNSELLANLGNFVNRATKFTKDNFDYKVPEMVLNVDDWEMIALVNREVVHYINLLEDAREREAISAVFSISRLGNQLMQHNTPWKLVKGDDKDKVRAGTVVGISVNLACLLSVLIQPYMPNLSLELQTQLGVEAGSMDFIPENFSILLPPGHRIGEPSPLVAEIKQTLISDLKVRYAGKQNTRVAPDTKPGETKPAPEAKPAGGVDPVAAAALEVQVAEQGEKVRELKARKAEKDEITGAVAQLLDLKKRLAAAQGVVLPAPEKKGKKKK
jgi:methionyl-tRNA synthetase